MELPKSIESLRTSVKFRLDCKDKKDLFTLSKLLDRQVVLKVGKKEAMEREYTIAADLASYKIPNFITFYCILSQDFQAVPFECKIEENGIDPLYFVLMPYYPMGKTRVSNPRKCIETDCIRIMLCVF